MGSATLAGGDGAAELGQGNAVEAFSPPLAAQTAAGGRRPDICFDFPNSEALANAISKFYEAVVKKLAEAR